MINENLYDKNGGLIFTHVGQIIHSTTLDTEEKVKAIYGGVRWQKIEGRFLLGQSNDYAIGSMGGEALHTLTVDEMPSHTHRIRHNTDADGPYLPHNGTANSVITRAGGTTTTKGTLTDRASGDYRPSSFNASTGGGQAHNNMPPYKVVFIWERTE